MKTFFGGVHPKGNKELSKDCIIREMPAPKLVSIPLVQHLGPPATPVVAVGETVKKGQLIAKSSAFTSANVFCSVSGTVKEIKDRLDASGGKSAHIVVENDGLETEELFEKLKNPTPEQIVKRLKEAGIVGMGGAGFPTHIKMTPPKGKTVDTFIINAAECEPYITCDYRIMLEYTERFLLGAKLLAKALSLEEVTIGIESNKPDAVAALKKTIETKGFSNINIVELKVKYPQGAEKQLIYAVTKRKVPVGGLPADVGVVVSNVHTALSTFYAVFEGQAPVARILTVSGLGINEPANLWVRTGTTFADVIEFLGGESQTPTLKLINGGPMMGKAVPKDTVAVTKTTSCILLLSRKEYDDYDVHPCINCGKCGKACPMHLLPMYIDRDCLADDFEGAKKYGAPSCIECGCCSYVCPAKRPLVQSVALAKKAIRERKI